MVSGVRTARSILFDVWLYGSMAVMGVVLLPATLSRRWTIWAMRAYCVQALFMLERICGLRVEVRGVAPAGAALLAAKHQSFLDVLVLMRTLPAPAFVMKRSLAYAPIFGLYALRIGCAPVDRAGGASALKRMRRRLARVRGSDPDAQIVIFPQGSRTPPGAIAPYKRGVAALYEADAAPCALAATNAGLFWPRGGWARRPGVAVVEFLEPTPAGLGKDVFMARIERDIETATARLEAEAALAEAASVA